MAAGNGTIIEVFGWKSKETLESTLLNPEVQTMWNKYSKVCRYMPLGTLKDAENIFSEFTPIN